MDEDNPREQTAPPPDTRKSARVPIMLAVSGVVLATALGTIATVVSSAPKSASGQPSNNAHVQVNPYTGQTVGTSTAVDSPTPTEGGSPTPTTAETSTTAPTTTRRMIVTTTSGPHGITTITTWDSAPPSKPGKPSSSNPPTDPPPTDPPPTDPSPSDPPPSSPPTSGTGTPKH